MNHLYILYYNTDVILFESIENPISLFNAPSLFIILYILRNPTKNTTAFKNPQKGEKKHSENRFHFH